MVLVSLRRCALDSTSFDSYYGAAAASVLARGTIRSFVAQFQDLAPKVGAVKVKVFFFAAIREIAGQTEMTLELPAGVTTVKSLAVYLEATVARLAGRLGAVRWAKNEEFVDLDAKLEDGDVVAIIPPVAGGSI